MREFGIYKESGIPEADERIHSFIVKCPLQAEEQCTYSTAMSAEYIMSTLHTEMVFNIAVMQVLIDALHMDSGKFTLYITSCPFAYLRGHPAKISIDAKHTRRGCQVRAAPPPKNPTNLMLQSIEWLGIVLLPPPSKVGTLTSIAFCPGLISNPLCTASCTKGFVVHTTRLKPAACR